MLQAVRKMDPGVGLALEGGLADWRVYIRDGGQYLSTARNAVIKGRVAFTPEILYNLAAMAIEKFLMGYLMSRGDLADNHTLMDLIRAVEVHAGPQPELSGRLRFLDSFQEICHLDTYRRRVPSLEDVPVILSIAAQVRSFVMARVDA